MNKRFSGGVRLKGHKSLSGGLYIELMPTPNVLVVPLKQHAGSPATPAVRVGSEVKKGTLIGKADSKNSCNVFSPCCGKVRAIEKRAVAGGFCDCIIIDNNQKTDVNHFDPLDNPTAQQIVDRVRDCGIAGMGGAGFPTAIKLSPDSKIDTLIINGAECEPYITCDYRIMREYTARLVAGAKHMQTALSAEKVIFGVEKNKAEAISALKEYLSTNNITDMSVVPLSIKYPQGSDRQLIYTLTGKKIAKQARSSKYGVVVQNVHTALSVYFAVDEGRPLYSRVVTVTGGALTTPKNVWVALGATFKDVIEFCGGAKEGNPPVRIISGGAMTGSAVYTTDIPVTKTTGCILLLGKSEALDSNPSSCINCGKCASICPMGLMPMTIDRFSLAGRYDEAEYWGALHCIECGCCSYICPAKRQLVQSVALAKSKLKGRK